MRALIAFLTLAALVLPACSAESRDVSSGPRRLEDGGESAGDSTVGEDGGVVFSSEGDAAVVCKENEVAENGRCLACSDVSFTIDTKQSCSLDILPGYAVDGEGFLGAGTAKAQRIFAMDRWGAGHVIAWCDSTTLPQLLSAVNAREYLGRSKTARVASFGGQFLCDSNLPIWVKYQGEDLPARYKGNAQALAKDWDAIIDCRFATSGVPTDWSAEIAEFVSVHGKGFLAAMDYVGVGVTKNDVDAINLITRPVGIRFNAVSLDWGAATLNAKLGCIPDAPDLF